MSVKTTGECAYFQSYRLQNLETKGIHQSSCEDGVLWAWLLLGECLLSPAHKVGYLIGAISLVIWTVGCLLARTHVQSAGCQWSLLVAMFVVNVVSFVGAVLSLQIMLLITYDMITSAIIVVIMLAAAVEALVRQCRGRRKYQAVCKTAETKTTPKPTQQRALEVASHKVCGVQLCLGITSLLTVAYVTVTGPIDLKEDNQQTSVNGSQVQGLQHQVLVKVVGYLLGCLACLGRLWIEIIIVSRFLKEAHANRVWKGGGVMLLTSDIFYILGVLLQSGSFRVTIVTLPWLLGRAVQICFQLFTLVHSTLMRLRPLDKYEDECNDEQEEENTNDLEAVTLLGSSESEESNRPTNVLYDRSWSDTGKDKAHITLKEAPSSLPESHTSTGADDVTTTSDSELSSTSQEHELVREDDFTSHRTPAPIDSTVASLLRLQRLSLASQIETLSRTSSETSDQRVRSWISQSTPEEPSPSYLTLTLNLDTAHDSVFNMDGENFSNRKFNRSSSFPLSPRKNSF